MSILARPLGATITCLLLSALSSQSYADRAIEGYWEGTFWPLKQPFVFTIASQDGSGYSLIVESPSSPGKKWTADRVSVDEYTLNATLDELASRIECTLSDDGKHLKGTWHFSDEATRINFVRRETKPEIPGHETPESETKAASTGVAFSFPDLNGRVTSPDDDAFAGKVVLVDIWGTWCPPCRAGTPYLVKLDKRYRDRGLSVIGVAIEHEQDADKRLALVKDFVKEYEIDYTILDAGAFGDGEWEEIASQIARMLGIENFQGFPTALLLDRTGSLDFVEVGISLESIATLERRIESLLNE